MAESVFFAACGPLVAFPRPCLRAFSGDHPLGQGVEAFHVVAQAHQLPFAGHFFFAPQAEAAKAED